MDFFGKKLFLWTGIVLIAGSYLVMDDSIFAAVYMRWMGFGALVLMLLFRD